MTREEKIYNDYVNEENIAQMVEYALECGTQTAEAIADRFPESERLSEIVLLSRVAKNNDRPIGAMKYISYSREKWIAEGEEAVEKLMEMKESL